MSLVCPRCGASIEMDRNNLTVVSSPYSKDDDETLVIVINCWACTWMDNWWAADLIFHEDEETD